MLNWSGFCYILVEWRVERWRCFDFSSVKMLILIWAQHILWILLFLNQAFVLLVSKNKQYKRWPNCALSYVCFKYRIAAKLTHLVEIFNVISSFFPSYSFAMLSAWDWIVYVMSGVISLANALQSSYEETSYKESQIFKSNKLFLCFPSSMCW